MSVRARLPGRSAAGPGTGTAAEAGEVAPQQPDEPAAGPAPEQEPVPVDPPVLVTQPSRAELVAAAVAGWQDALAELPGLSTLADVDLLGEAALDLSAAHPSGIAQLFAGRATRLSNLVRDGAVLSAAKRRAQAVRTRSEEYALRHGVAPVYLAIGVASWTEEDGTAVRAPVLLRPATLRPRGGASGDMEIGLEPSLEVNPLLAHALRSRGALLDAATLARGAFTGSGFDPQPGLARLEALGHAVLDDFRLTERLLLGTFLQPSQVLLEDVSALAADLESHDVVAALAGDEDAMARLTRPLPERERADRDPNAERGVGDLDPAQAYALDVVTIGRDLFIDAPLGCDVAGTVAAIVADATASGRSVLYVPGHRRAADALGDRLAEHGLSDLLLDVAPYAGRSSEIGRRLLSGMTVEAPALDASRLLADRAALVRLREQLAGYVAALHARREPWNASAYQALQSLAALTASRPVPRTKVRLAPEVAAGLAGAELARAREELVQAAALGAFTLSPTSTAWFGADLTSDEAAQDALGRVQRLQSQSLPELRRRIAEVSADTGLIAATSAAQWGEQLGMLAGVRAALDLFQPMVFERSAADMIAATATPEWREEHGVTMPRAHRHRLRKQAKDMLRPGQQVDDLHGALVELQRQREIWQVYCPAGGWPRIPEGMATIEAEYRQVREDLGVLTKVLATTPAGAGLFEASLDDLEHRLARLSETSPALAALPERTMLLRGLQRRGLGPLLVDLAERRVEASMVGAELDLAWWSTVFGQIVAGDPFLGGYDGAALAALAERFRRADRAQVASLPGPVRNAVVATMHTVLRAHREQAELLFAELVEDRLVSLREAYQTYPDVLPAIRPCLVGAPMMVPKLLPPRPVVDLVIIDAAQHLRTEHVVSAIARGRQVVVIGDRRRALGSAVRELAAALPTVELDAYPTARDPYLTAFIAAHGYQHMVRNAPLPSDGALVTFDVVDGSGMPPPGGAAVETTDAEVERVVDLVIEHALTRPQESLAVIACSPAHADRVREAVMSQLAGNPALAAFFDAGHAEPVTVCDLAGAAELSRDAVILTVGYGKTPHGRVLHRFGQLSGPDGEVLLLGALCVTRSRLSVVSCFAMQDLDPHRLRGPGAKMLGALLEFAEQRSRGEVPNLVADAVDSSEDSAVPDRLVVDLAELLWRHGLRVEIGYGLPGGLRIPLAVGHPDLPDELLVAVLTDDDAYTAEPSVRVRDRIVGQRLERLGWTVVQVWSVAAFLDPQREADAIRDAVLRVLAERTGGQSDPDAGPRPGARSGGGPRAGSGRPGAVRKGIAPRSGGAEPGVQAELELGGTPFRPAVQPGLPISAYTAEQLDELLAWIVADGLVRDDGQLAGALRAELGVTRRSIRIDAAIGDAVRRLRTLRS